MASELKLNGATTGATIYAVIENEAGQLWNGTTFEAFNAANWATYKVALTEQAGTGRFRADFPTAILSPGVYNIEYRLQDGGAAAVDDAVVSTDKIEWTGDQLNSFTDLTAKYEEDAKTFNVRLSAYNISGNPVEGVSVAFKRNGTTVKTVTTGRNGNLVANLSKGTYVLDYTVPEAYAAVADQTVTVDSDKGINVNLVDA